MQFADSHVIWNILYLLNVELDEIVIKIFDVYFVIEIFGVCYVIDIFDRQ